MLGADYDDAYIAWLNGVEIARFNMPAGNPTWNTSSLQNGETANGSAPEYRPHIDVTATALPALVSGVNVLAIGAWNSLPSSDLVLVPQLIADPDPRLERGPYLQEATPTSLTIRWRTLAPADSLVSRLRQKA